MAIGAHADDIEFNVVSYHERGYEIIYIMATNNMSSEWSRILPDGTREVRKVPWYETMRFLTVLLL